MWHLTTTRTSYVVGLDQGGRLVQVYWGQRLAPQDVQQLPRTAGPIVPPYGLPLEVEEQLPVDGGLRWGPASLQVTFPGGVRSLEPVLVGERIEQEKDAARLDLTMADVRFPLEVVLHYRVREASEVIERWVTLRHTDPEGETFEISRADAGSWLIPPMADYRYSVASGGYYAEGQVRRGIVPEGEYTLSSRTGITGHHSNPWTMIDDGTATEGRGEVWSVALAWSGSWRLTTQRRHQNRVAVSGGFGHEGLTLPLAPGGELTTPSILGLHSAEGFGGVSRAWHAHARTSVLPHPDEIRPVVYNSWEAVGFDLNQDQQTALARQAAELGAELFVIDDGWFSTRTHDRAGLGDWWPNPARFPNGLAPFAREVHRLGMAFGIWVEPEAVNPDSDLYRTNPHWVLHHPDRQRDELRSQLVLNFAREDVRMWALGWLNALVADGEIDFLKWDMNRAFTQAGWPEDGEGQNRLWIEHTRGVYHVIDRLRARHPRLRIESCAGGGGRLDYGILERTDQVWTSDDTVAHYRQSIQHGFSQLYPACVMSAWVTDQPYSTDPQRNQYAYHVAMAGALGIGGDLNAWNDRQREQARENIAVYKAVRVLVQQGEQYRLGGQPGESLSAIAYVDNEDVAVFVYRPRVELRPHAPSVLLAGLDPDAVYTDLDRPGFAVSGRFLMTAGVPVHDRLPSGDWSSTLIRLRRTG
ncbi:alpha-galactosidase [Streptomyces sp. WAC 06738]|uniref:alpha-galactosidase n=1 Tax=Streptomyces sp. WAC 06738 TaxID=2203210 RepID=UPI0023E84ACA|nr:alpha-galactosidase [Streptomyces sp. WAC 06738]